MSVFHLPDLGEGLHDAEIVEWHVAPGDHVEAGQTLVSVETDKAVIDIPSPRAGMIAVIHGEPASRLEVGEQLVEFDDGERQDTGTLVGRLPADSPQPGQSDSRSLPRPEKRVSATPAVRARARALGVDLVSVAATGSEGQVTLADLEQAASRAAQGEPGAAENTEALRGARRTMAVNMAHAHAEVATATVTDDAIVQHWGKDTDVTILLVRAIAAAAVVVPELNVWLDGPSLHRTAHTHVHVGVAVDSPDGLFVPVLRNTESRDSADLRHDLDRLIAEIESRKISHDNLKGATITLSNYGTLCGRYAALALMPPQVAILGVGAAVDRVVAVDGAPAVRRTVPLSLTFDHRAVTGGEAARFLAAVKECLEEQK